MDLKVLCKSLSEAKDLDSKLELIDDIQKTIMKHGIIYPNIDKFFKLLSDFLLSKETKIIIAILKVLKEIIDSDTPEVEASFPVFFPPLISHFEDIDHEIREASVNTLIHYIKKTRNIESVLPQYIKFGINSQVRRVRQKSAKYLPSIIAAEKNVFYSNTGVYEIRKVIENLIVRLNDESTHVQEDVEKTLFNLWKTYDAFQKILPKLATQHQTLFYKRIVQSFKGHTRLDPDLPDMKVPLTRIPQSESIFKIDSGLLRASVEMPQSKPIEMQAKEDWPVSKNGLFFGFVNEKEMAGLLQNENWRLICQDRLDALKNLEDKIMNFPEFFDLNAYLGSFFKLLRMLLEDKHFPILTCLYQILSKKERILDIPGVKNKIALHSLLNQILPTLGDPKVALRKDCLDLSLQIIKMMKIEVSVTILIKFLDTDNWHQKEEILRLVIASYLGARNEGKYDFDQKPVINKIAALIEDPSSKVRLAALETLTVICYSVNRIDCMEIVQACVANEFCEVILDAMHEGKVAYLNQTEIVDFARDKFKELIRIQRLRDEKKLLAEIQMNDITQLKRAEDSAEQFDYEQFVMEETNEEDQSENSENQMHPQGSQATLPGQPISNIQSQESLLNPQSSTKSVKFNLNAKEELIKDPKLDLKSRVKESSKKPSKTHKNIVKIVNGNTDAYKDYEYETHSNPSQSQILFAKDVPSELIQSEVSEQSIDPGMILAEEENKKKQEEEQKQKEIEESKDPYQIFEEVFDEGHTFQNEELPDDKKKIIAEIKHYKKKKKNKKELYQEQPKDPREESLRPDEKLTKLPFADFYIKNILLDLRVTDLELQFEAVNNLRRVALFNEEALYTHEVSIHSIVKELLKVFRDNKEPVLLRNVLLALRLLFERLKQVLDMDIDDIVSVLVDKSIKEELSPRTIMELKYCLGSFIQNLTEDKIVLALSKYLTESKAKSKLIPLLCMEKLIIKSGKNYLEYKGVGKLLSLMIPDLTHPEVEIRRVARRGFYKLVESGTDRRVLERFFKDCSTEDEYNKFVTFMEKTDRLRSKPTQEKTDEEDG